MKQKQVFGSLIGGSYSSQGKRKFKTFNPDENDYNDVYYIDATPDDINTACKLAQESFAYFSQTSSMNRAEFLSAIVQEIEAIHSDLVHLYCSETGYTMQRAENELSRTLNQLQQFRQALTEDYFKYRNNSIIKSTSSHLKKVHVPIGPVAVFGASNFPLAFSTAGGDTASAFAAGCPVLVKAHPHHAGTSNMVAKAITRAIQKTNMPEGIFSHLIGHEYRVGAHLVKNKHIKGVGFTGSLQGGKALIDIAINRPEPIPVFAEMGSVNPVIIFSEKIKDHPEAIAQQIADAIALGSGQFCTCPGLIIGVANDAFDNFIELIASFLELKPKGKMIHPKLKANYELQKERFLKNTLTQCITSERSVDDQTTVPKLLLSTKDVDFLNHPEMHHEVFGPFALAVRCRDFSFVKKVVASLKGQLTATVFATEAELIDKQSFLNLLQQKAGRLIFNQVPTGVEVSPDMQHGGPFPATSDARFTSVGLEASFRWLRPVTYQGFPKALLPHVLL